MERLCISSFLQNGHPFHLYVYQDTEGIPPGTIVMNGEEILPASALFTYREHSTYAGFANFFRYKLLLEKGGWFVDLDTICLRPFQFAAEYVFSSERSAGQPGVTVNLAAIKAPPGSPILQWAWDTCQSFDPQQLSWGQAGPLLLTRGVEEHKLTQYIQSPEVFCSLDHTKWNRVIERGMPWRPGFEAFAVHLWNERWRRAGQDKDAQYDPGCFYERLKRQYLESEAKDSAVYDELLPLARRYFEQLQIRFDAGQSEPELTVVMLSHGRVDRTRHAIQCLFEHVTIPFHLLLVDNASDGATRKALQELKAAHPGIELILLDENLGCAAGRMFALDHVRTDFVMLLDNDVSVLPGAVEHLLRALKDHPEAVASTGRVVLADGRVHLCGGRFLLEDGLVQAELLDFGRRLDEPIGPSGPCDWVPGGMTVVRTAVLQCHRYDPKLTVYHEDLEWCLRLKRQDPPAVFLRCIEALGVHYHEPKRPDYFVSDPDPIAQSMPYLETMAYLYGAHKLVPPGVFAFLPELGPPSPVGFAVVRLLFELLNAKGGEWFEKAWASNHLHPLLARHDPEKEQPFDGLQAALDQRDQAIQFLQRENGDLRASLQNREEAVAFLQQENAPARKSWSIRRWVSRLRQVEP